MIKRILLKLKKEKYSAVSLLKWTNKWSSHHHLCWYSYAASVEVFQSMRTGVQVVLPSYCGCLWHWRHSDIKNMLKFEKRNIDNISFCWPLLSVYNQHFFMRKDQRDHLPVSMSASLVQPALPRAAGATAAASELPAASHGDEASHAAGSCLCQPDHR